MFFILLSTSFFALISCQNIETGDSIDEEIRLKIKELGLLDDEENIIQFYSNYEKDKAGNFFTDKRIAHYWLVKNSDSKADISSAYYQEILSIDTTFKVHDFDIPFMTIKKKDGNTFKVYVDGTFEEEKAFFENAIKFWQERKDAK